MKKHYKVELNQAKKFLADIEQRGDEAFGDDWEKLRQEIFSPEEIAKI